MNNSKRKNSIISLKKDIQTLKKMLEMYGNTTNLNGGFYVDMMSEIHHQIKHCEECITNLEKIGLAKL